MTSEFPAQRDSNVENVSIWWRHHDASTHPCVTSPVGHVLPRSPEVGLNTLSWLEDPGPRFHPRHPDPPRDRHGRSRKRKLHWLSPPLTRYSISHEVYGELKLQHKQLFDYTTRDRFCQYQNKTTHKTDELDPRTGNESIFKMSFESTFAE